MSDFVTGRPPARPRAAPAAVWPYMVAGVVILLVGAAVGAMVWPLPMLSDLGRFLAQAGLRALPAATVMLTLVWFGFVRRTGREVVAPFLAAFVAAAMLGTIFPRLILPVLTGESAMAERAVAWEARQQVIMQQDADAFDAELQSIDPEHLLSPSGLGSPRAFADTQARLVKARQIVARHRDIMSRHQLAARAELTRLDGPEVARKRLLANFDQRVEARLPLFEEYWELQDDMLDELDALTTLLKDHRGSWMVMQGHLGFTDRGLLERFNRHVEILTTKRYKLRETRRRLTSPYAGITGTR